MSVSFSVDTMSSSAVVYDLQEPLITRDERPSLLSPLRLKCLALSTGSLTAAFSQLLLTYTLWDETILSQSTTSIVWFSMIWSFWTCMIIFGAMVALTQTIKQFHTTEDWDDLIFHMEAHHIVGSLLTITGSWMSQNLMKTPLIVHPMIFLGLLIGVYAILFFVSTRTTSEEEDKEELSPQESLLGTYQVVAGTLGFIVGLSSQFLLSFFLWKGHMLEPIVENVYLFSLLWSALTVAITFLGCSSLRLLTDESQASKDEDRKYWVARTFLRMESHYVFCSLIGVCLAWILMDILFGLTDQVVPSLMLLAASLLAFAAIVHWFPEEECVRELIEQV